MKTKKELVDELSILLCSQDIEDEANKKRIKELQDRLRTYSEGNFTTFVNNSKENYPLISF